MPTYSPEQYEKVSTLTDQLAPEPKAPVMTARSVVKKEYARIQVSLSRGVKHRQILSCLQASGQQISMGTYRQSLRDIRKEQIVEKARATRAANRLKSQSASKRPKKQKEN